MLKLRSLTWCRHSKIVTRIFPRFALVVSALKFFFNSNKVKSLLTRLLFKTTQIIMTTQILKTVLAGMLAGLALFLLPFFLLRVFIFCLIIGGIFRLMGWGRHNRMRREWMERYSHMSDEERAAFRSRFGHRHCYAYTQDAAPQSTTSNPL